MELFSVIKKYYNFARKLHLLRRDVKTVRQKPPSVYIKRYIF